MNNFKESLAIFWNYVTQKKIEKHSLFLICIFLLSVLDATFTLIWIKAGLAVEANPILAPLVEHGDFSFVATKIFLTGAGCYILESVKTKYSATKYVIYSLLTMYCLVTLYHFFGVLASLDYDMLPEKVSELIIWAS